MVDVEDFIVRFDSSPTTKIKIMYDIETKEDEWNYLNNEETIKTLQELDEWLEKLSEENGTTKY